MLTKKVLLIDDDPAFVKVVGEHLEDKGYVVYSGYDGAMAIALARREKPDVILLDVSMPVVNGLKAFEYLRGHPDTCEIPVIFISEVPSVKIYQTVEFAQRVAHLKKPADLPDVDSILRHFLHQYQAA